MNDLKPIETYYAGHMFRSRLEARWAILFDLLGVRWFYEYEGYETRRGRYVPDFWLPEVYLRSELRGVFVEIKPKGHEGDHVQLEAVARSQKAGGILAIDFNYNGTFDWQELIQVAPWWDVPMLIYKCRCGMTKFEFCEGSYMNCHVCGRTDVDYSEATISAAYDRAVAHRFW